MNETKKGGLYAGENPNRYTLEEAGSLGFIGGKRVAIYGYASVDGGRRSRRFEFSGSGRDLYRAIRAAHRVVPSNRQRFVTVSAREFLRAPYRYGVEGVWVDKEIES